MQGPTTLTYLQVHAYYNIPPLIFLALAYRPLLTKGDVRKYLFLVVIAVLYTTPWDNYIIYRKAWQYCPSCVMGTIGLVPVEEYLFFITQTLSTCLLHSILVRCLAGLPATAIRKHKSFPIGACAIVVGTVSVGIMWLLTAWYDPKTFYMRAILLWTAPVILFLYTISALTTRFMFFRIVPTILALFIPTVYLWVIDSIAIRAGTWHINEATSLEIFLWDGLPIEEATFFIVTNAMVVLGCNGFDLAYSIVHTYDQSDDFSFPSLFQALLCRREEQVVEDLKECVKVLRKGSSSFYNSSFFFSEVVRRNLIVLYAFCRYTDDVTDDTTIDSAIRASRISKLKQFVTENFSQRDEMQAASRKTEDEIHANDDPIQRSMLRFLAHKVPREPIIELLEGYEWDLILDTSSDRSIRQEEDILQYARHVASSVAEMCMYIVDDAPKAHVVIAARDMGVVLQLTNVARDILTDAIHGRTYVPETWFPPGDREKLLVLAKSNPVSLARHPVVREIRPEQYALRLLHLATLMHKLSSKTINELPEDAQVGIRIATDGYFAIGQHLAKICDTGEYPVRARLSRVNKLKLIAKHLYRPTNVDILILGGCLLRLLLLFYGHWQDNQGGNVRYTDVDYVVFTDAAKFVQAGGSPYERSTYRYTPILAWLLIPNQFFSPWGKVVFAAGDIFAGWLMIKILRMRSLSVNWSAIWLLNPMVAVISTRGNCEGLLGAMAIAVLYMIQSNQIVFAGLILGLAVHFKIYPLIYAPSVVWALHKKEPTTRSTWQVYHFFNRNRIVFGLSSLMTFLLFSVVMFHIYGMEFVQHTFLYHISRSDHRHNFSPYHLYLYLSSAPSIELAYSNLAPLFTFLPQLILSCILIPLALAKRDLTTCFFAQTFTFVAYNKVVTSQYFMWYLVFLPLYLPRSPFIRAKREGLSFLLAWIFGQAVWLYFAYGFEILGRNTLREMWLATILFFLVNICILVKVIDAA